MAPRLSLLLSLFLLAGASAASPCPYLSGAATLRRDYQNMVKTLKVFVYDNSPPNPFSFQDFPAASLFYDSLLRSPFITADPNQAHLFFVPFSPAVASTRALGRVVRQLRTSHPYWNKTLGADHFFLSPSGVDFSGDRNVLELKKNAVQISVFAAAAGRFIPHKDVTLPPFFNNTSSPLPASFPAESLAYLNWDGKTDSETVNAVKSKLGGDFLILDRPGKSDHLRALSKTKFCLFLYGGGGVSTVAEAMGVGCVPLLIVDRPIQDLPLMDVLRWSDVAILARGAHGALKAIGGVDEEKYSEMRSLAVAASLHLRWNEAAEPMDAFHMVMYQLWKRRHVIRYSRREDISF